MIHLGRVRPGSTIYCYFDSFDGGTGASITLTGLATTDIEIYKDGSNTTRASDSGYALLGTDGIDEFGTGIHGFSVNLADNGAANFYEAGSHYVIVIASVTVDAQTVNFVYGDFWIGYEGAILDTTIATLGSQTSFTLEEGPAEDDALNGCVAVIHDLASAVQLSQVFVSDYTGASKTVTLAAGATFTAAAGDSISFMPRMDQWGLLGTVLATPTVAGVQEVDITHFGGTGGTFAAGRPEVNTTHAAGTAWGSGAITAAAIATGAIDADAIADNAIDAGAIATGAITSAKFAAGAIDAAAIATGAIDADALAADASTEIRSLASGTSDAGGSTTTMVDAARTEADTDYWAGQIIVFTSGTVLGQARQITAFTPASDTITFAPAVTQSVGAGITYEIWPSYGGLRPTTVGRALDVSAGGEAGLDWANIGSPTTAQNLSATNIDVDQIVASVSGNVTGSVGSVAAGGITSGSFAAGAIDATAIAANAIGASELAADAVAEIADAVWDEDATAHQTGGTFGQAIGDPGADTTTIYQAVVTDAAGATIAADIASVQSDTNDIQTRLPAALVGGRMDSSVGAMAAATITAAAIATDAIDADALADGAITAATFAAGAIDATAIANGAIDAATFAAGAIDAAAIADNAIDAGAIAADAITAAKIATGAIDADALAADAVTEIRAVVSGTADSGTNTTMVDAARTEADTDYWKDMAILFTSGTISGQARLITAFNPATDTITFSPATTQAVGTNTYEIIPNVAAAGATAPTAAEVADAVWDEDATAHQTGGTFGQAIGDPGADATTIYQSVVTDAAGTNIAADIIAIEAQTDDIGVAGAGLTAVPWNAAWDAEVQSEVQDALDGTIADSVPADGTRPSISQALYMLTQFMLERAVVATTVTVNKPDGTTALFTLTLNDATNPTTITRST